MAVGRMRGGAANADARNPSPQPSLLLGRREREPARGAGIQLLHERLVGVLITNAIAPLSDGLTEVIPHVLGVKTPAVGQSRPSLLISSLPTAADL